MTTPLLVLHGSNDSMADIDGSIALVDRASSSDKTLCVWPEGHHALLRDLNRVDVGRTILTWILERLPAVE